MNNIDNQQSSSCPWIENAASKERINPDLYRRYGVKRGLRNENGTGVLVGLTEIGEVFSYVMDDRERIPAHGHLYYRGFDLRDLVDDFYPNDRFGYEEISYLLLFGSLPNQDALQMYKEVLGENRKLPSNFIEDMIFKNPSPDLMNKLARCVLGLYTCDKNADDISADNVIAQSIRLIARFPALVSYAYLAKRHYIDGESLYLRAPKPEYSAAENILYLIRPTGAFTHEEAKLLDLALVLHADHGGGNNSTFTCRCVSSTGSDTYSAIAAAIGALKGPQHGGASAKTFAMMQEMKENLSNWRDEAAISDYLRKLLNKEAFDKKGLIYGIGHAVYMLSDPRSVQLKEKARQMAYTLGREDEYEFYLTVERLAPQVFYELKGHEKPLCANVDFYAGFIYDMLGIPVELFTPLFACSRISGWCAHRLEEIVSAARIIRPAYKSVSKRKLFIPLDKRDDKVNK